MNTEPNKKPFTEEEDYAGQLAKMKALGIDTDEDAFDNDEYYDALEEINQNFWKEYEYER